MEVPSFSACSKYLDGCRPLSTSQSVLLLRNRSFRTCDPPQNMFFFPASLVPVGVVINVMFNMYQHTTESLRTESVGSSDTMPLCRKGESARFSESTSWAHPSSNKKNPIGMDQATDLALPVSVRCMNMRFRLLERDINSRGKYCVDYL